MALVSPQVVGFSRLSFQAAFLLPFCPVYGLCRAFSFAHVILPGEFFGDSRAVLVPVWMLYNSFHIRFSPGAALAHWEILPARRFCLSEYGSGRDWKILEMEDFSNLFLVRISRICQMNF